jgi:iron complex transport system permease protein
MLFNPLSSNILWALKLPRLLLAITAGVLLSISGSIFQGILGNRREAANYIIWLALAAAASSVLALLFAIFSLNLSPDYSLWFFGGFSSAGWHKAAFMFPILFLSLVIAVFYYKDLNALLLGEDIATTLGISVIPARIFLISISIFLAAGGIFLFGIASIVLLIAPFFVKLAIGANYKNLFPVSVLTVVALVLMSDILGRVLMSSEIPAGAILVVTGLPFIVYIFMARRSM